MLPTTWTYYFLIGLLVLLYYTVALRKQNLFLLAASFGVYGLWGLVGAAILLVVTLISYSCARFLESKGKYKKCICGIAIFSTIGVLFIYKYFDFVLQNIGFGGVLGKSLVVPIGLSFFTFQCYAYVMDVYHGKLRAECSLVDYALFVSFFPHVSAGPIARASSLLPQLKQRRTFEWKNLLVGVHLIFWGLFKKIVVADRIAQLVHGGFEHPQNYSGISLLFYAYLYTVQIYCDFSGYSEIAIGVARLFGIKLGINFSFPYFAKSIGDFWRRWHISLTKWFADYLYIPLGGNRVGRAKWLRNILLVFLVSGLWHGANWTYVAWGGIHGVAYLLEKGALAVITKTSRLTAWLHWLITFHVVAFAWVFFRCPSVHTAMQYLRGICCNPGHLNVGGSQVIAVFDVLFVGLVFLIEGIQHFQLFSSFRSRNRYFLKPVFWVFLGVLIALFAVNHKGFIYYQF